MKKNIVMSVLSALFAAFIVFGAYVSIPLPFTPVPIVLQNMFVLLACISLGLIWGPVSVTLYLLLGIIGLPVFAGGGKGIAVILGPTGGYLISYFVISFFIGFMTMENKTSFLKAFIVLLIASIIVYLIGVPWLKFRTNMSWTKAFIKGCLPFLIGDFLKVIVASLVGVKLKDFIKKLAG